MSWQISLLYYLRLLIRRILKSGRGKSAKELLDLTLFWYFI